MPLHCPGRAPAHLLPGVVDRVLKVFPGALVAPLPLTAGLSLHHRPILAGVALISHSLNLSRQFSRNILDSAMGQARGLMLEG